MNNWDLKFIEKSIEIAQWSKDTNRKNGAIIVDDDNNIRATGYNGFPRKCDDSILSRYEQPVKYLYTEHAERNALYSAARIGISVKGCTMYTTMFPCADCARGIIQTGIKKLISPPPDVEHEKWGPHFKAALVMLEEANVDVVFI